MIEKLINLSVQKSILILAGVLFLLALGVHQYTRLPIDAFPDISPVMVPIFAEAHGMAPEEIERLITFPIESAMNGLPGVTQIKSTSAFGMAVIYVYFHDDTDMYFARQIVSERLAGAMSDLPELHEPPKLGPISTGLGQIFIYYLTADETVDTGGKEKNTWLREVNDWIVKFQMQTVPGVTDILSIGGHVLQYQIQIDPYLLTKYNVALEDIIHAVRDNNRNAGGQFLIIGSEEYLIRGIGLVETLEDIRNIQITVRESIPVTIGDLANVQYGKEVRRGVVTHNGKEEVVSGMVLQLYGENTSHVIERLYKKLPDIQKSLPKGVTLVPYYEQAELVQKATGTVKTALLQGAALVIIILFLFLGNVQTAFIVAFALPLCVLIAFICMSQVHLSANLMSLGGIAIGIGMLGDGAIVMVENIYRRLSTKNTSSISKKALVVQAGSEVSRPILFSISIIIIVFLPLFSLEGIEGKMFSPMAYTISFALLGSLVVALFVTPALSYLLLTQNVRREFIFNRMLKQLYRPLLHIALKVKIGILIFAVSLFIVSLLLVPHLGTEFIPTLEEGSILVGVTMAPSISLVDGTETVMKLEQRILKFQEVEQTVSRIGRPEAGSHPHPVNYAEVHIDLKPSHEWPKERTKGELVHDLNEALSGYPGVQLNFTQPIQNAFDELLSGIKAQFAIKLFGDDLAILQSKAKEIKNSIDMVPGLVDVAVEQSFGQPQVQVIVDRVACARYGVTVSKILELVEVAVGGEVIDQIFLQNRRFGIHVRYKEQYRSDVEAIKNLLVQSADGSLIPLIQLAAVKKVVGPIQINREMNQRRWVVQANIRDRDLGNVVADVQKIISEKITLPSGYYIQYGGQFENQQRAMARLSIIVPLSILLIFLLLYLTFDAINYALLIILNIPLALIGGIWGLYLTGEYLSVPAVIGFIALFGIAVQNGVVLISSIRLLQTQGVPQKEAIIEGCLLRLRPVLMTAMTTVCGLIPLLLSEGIGAEVQRPLAIVVISGLISATILTLFILPALYSWFEKGGTMPHQNV